MPNKDLYYKRIENHDKILKILCDFDAVFQPPLSTFFSSLSEYANKLYRNAYVYAAVEEDAVVGFIAFYANDIMTRIAFGTLVAVVPEARGRNVAAGLNEIALEIARQNNMTEFRVEVNKDNEKSLRHLKKMGFAYYGEGRKDCVILSKKL